MSEIWEKMGNPMPFERVMGPNRHNMENFGDLQPIARSMKPALWVPSENLSLILASSLTGRYIGYMHNCHYQSSHVGRIYSKSKTESNMSEYRPDYLFLGRQRRLKDHLIIFINFLSYLSYVLKSTKIS